MTELFLIIKDFNTNYPDLLTWGITGALVLFGLVSQRKWLSEYISECKLNRLLRGVGIESLHNVTVTDGLDGSIFIENLILLPSRIILLGVKKYRGLIFAADKIDLWTQVIGNKSYKFENPLRQLESAISILNSKLESTKVDVKVLFITGSEFPKGKPENVITAAELNAWKEEVATAVPKKLRHDWEILINQVEKCDLDKGNSVLVNEVSASTLNRFSLFVTISLLTAWLVWRLI